MLRSQGGGGGGRKYAKYHIFSAFEADFCSKTENSLPKGIWEPQL